MRPFRLPGGEAGRSPWRSALALHWELGRNWRGAPADSRLLRDAWQRGLNSPMTTAAGRLFDAAAATLGLVHDASFEGQGPMVLEAIAAEGAAIDLPLYNEKAILRLDWAPLLDLFENETLGVAERAGTFQTSLAAAIVKLARRLRDDYAFEAVGLTGGCFQNRKLSEQALSGLENAGFQPRLAAAIPGNDAGISAGQIIEAAARDISG